MLLLLLVLISQWVRQTAQASTNTTLMMSIHYPPLVTVYTENNDIRIGYQSFSAALVICFNRVTCLVKQFFHLPLHKIHLSWTSVNVEPCINCIAWMFISRECNPLVHCHLDSAGQGRECLKCKVGIITRHKCSLKRLHSCCARCSLLCHF